MKNRKTLIAVIACLVLAFSFCLYGCGSSESTSAPEKHLLGYPEGYDTTSGGGSSYDGMCDNPDTPYFAINDYYNMESEGGLHILSNFSPYEQSTEYSCGPACGYMVLNWFGGDIDGDLIGCQGGTIEIRRHGTELIRIGRKIPVAKHLSVYAIVVPAIGGGIGGIVYLVAIHHLLLARLIEVFPGAHLKVGL